MTSLLSNHKIATEHYWAWLLQKDDIEFSLRYKDCLKHVAQKRESVSYGCFCSVAITNEIVFGSMTIDYYANYFF